MLAQILLVWLIFDIEVSDTEACRIHLAMQRTVIETAMVELFVHNFTSHSSYCGKNKSNKLIVTKTWVYETIRIFFLSMTFNYLDAYTPTLLQKKLKFTINYIDFLIDNLSFRHTSHLVCEVTCFYILKRAWINLRWRLLGFQKTVWSHLSTPFLGSGLNLPLYESCRLRKDHCQVF